MDDRRYYIHAFMLLLTLFVGCIVWTITTVLSTRAGGTWTVFLSVGCTCTCLMLMLGLLLCYISHSASSVVPVEPWLVVEVDGELRHLHVAESQTSPHALAIAVQCTADEPPASPRDRPATVAAEA